jgi:hypothetical protein
VVDTQTNEKNSLNIFEISVGTSEPTKEVMRKGVDDV